MRKPLVSVVMITYAHENFIEQAINGVLTQECEFEIELIIANDCSPDKTDKVVKEIINNHPKASSIKYIKHDNNLGMMLNFIFALNEAQGKYIALCEGDDYWTDPLKLQKQVGFLEKNPTFVLTFHNRSIKKFNGDIEEVKIGDKELKIPSKRMLSTFIPTLTMVFRNSIEEVNDSVFIKVFSGDVLIRSILSTKGNAYFMPFNGAVYRQHTLGVYSALDEYSALKSSLKSRDIIHKNLKGINKNDSYFSKFGICIKLLKYDLKGKKILKKLKLFVDLIVLMIRSKRILALKIFIIALKN